ncbi:MAG: Transcriptional regulatory protein sin3 [Thelocarpon impressellum]|nr:MAG: Transcriptional regulatory protein sin3 [Thelocarpon impressellum]
MRLPFVYTTLSVSVVATAASAQLVVPFIAEQPAPTTDRPEAHQRPIMETPNIALPPGEQGKVPTGPVIISDVIGIESSINIFAGFTRDIESVSKRLEDGSQNTTVLAPLNSAVTAQPRKPWEDARDYAFVGEAAYDGSEGEDRATANLRRYVEAHLVPVSPWKEGEKVQSIGGAKLWWEIRDGKKVIQPGGIEVSSVANKVANGEVWTIEGVIKH